MINKPICPVCGELVEANDSIEYEVYMLGSGIVKRQAPCSFEFVGSRTYKLWESEVFTCSGCKKDFIGFYVDDNEIDEKIHMITKSDLMGDGYNGYGKSIIGISEARRKVI